MSSFAVETTINAPIEKVWGTLADIGTIYRWNPGVVESHTTSDTEEGLGATRYCDLGGKNYLDEEVVTWKPNEQITMRITGTNMPFKAADIRFYLREEDGKTAVTCFPRLHPQIWPCWLPHGQTDGPQHLPQRHGFAAARTKAIRRRRKLIQRHKETKRQRVFFSFYLRLFVSL